MVDAVILDVDGTLIDSNDAHAESWVEALATEGLDVPFSRVRPLIGMGGDHLLPMVSGFTEGTATGKRVPDVRKRIFQEKYLPKLKPFPKVRELLERMRADGLQLVVASSSGDDLLQQLLEKANVADLIEHTTSKDDAEESKPEPDIIIAALKRARVPARRAIMLGDTPYDVTAAARAGVRTVAFQCGGWSPAQLSRAIGIYRDPADLLEHYATSPFVTREEGIAPIEAMTSERTGY